jgi:hypothetical protein
MKNGIEPMRSLEKIIILLSPEPHVKISSKKQVVKKGMAKNHGLLSFYCRIKCLYTEEDTVVYI